MIPCWVGGDVKEEVYHFPFAFEEVGHPLAVPEGSFENLVFSDSPASLSAPCRGFELASVGAHPPIVAHPRASCILNMVRPSQTQRKDLQAEVSLKTLLFQLFS